MPYVRTRLGRWYYQERGASLRPGAAAIVLWPSLLFDGGMWRFQVEGLSAIGRVISFDGPGHGKSEVPPPFSLEDNAEALVDALGDLRVEGAVIVGLSWGGMLGMRLALRHPELVRALALFDTSAEAEDPWRAAKYRVFAEFGRRLGLPRALAQAQIAPLMFSRRMRDERPDEVARFIRAASGFPREGTARAAVAVVVRRTDILDRLGSIRAPTLVACGTDDIATHPVHSERIARAIPGSRLVWIAGAGHASALEQPAAVNDVLFPFVRQHVLDYSAPPQATP